MEFYDHFTLFILISNLYLNVICCEEIRLHDNVIVPDSSRNGCIDLDDGINLAPYVSTCRGYWSGNIENAANLCATGFEVCSLEDVKRLKNDRNPKLTNESIAQGCFVLKVHHYEKSACSQYCAGSNEGNPPNDAENCPENNTGQKLGTSCCFNITNRQFCSFNSKNNITGVLCCQKHRNHADRLQRDENVPTAVQVVHLTGERVGFNCPLVAPSPKASKIMWYKNEKILDHATQTIWTIPNGHPKDSGLYSCRFDGDFGLLSAYHINLTVKEVQSSACADGTSEGFHDSQNVRGCAGAWKGHIRRADKQLCGPGWRVCTPKDKPFLMNIDSVYLTDFGGCFAYNAANIKSKCRRCQNKHSVVALGRDCLVNDSSASSSTLKKQRQRHPCYYDSRAVSIYSNKFLQQNNGGGCFHRPDNSVTGVLCCRKSQQNRHRLLQMDPPSPIDASSDLENVPNECYPACRNGGTCADGRCVCSKGYFGHACQHGGCNPRCLNGGVCLYGFCKCNPPFYGNFCQITQESFPDTNSSSMLQNHLIETIENGVR